MKHMVLDVVFKVLLFCGFHKVLSFLRDIDPQICYHPKCKISEPYDKPFLEKSNWGSALTWAVTSNLCNTATLFSAHSLEESSNRATGEVQGPVC